MWINRTTKQELRIISTNLLFNLFRVYSIHQIINSKKQIQKSIKRVNRQIKIHLEWILMVHQPDGYLYSDGYYHSQINCIRSQYCHLDHHFQKEQDFLILLVHLNLLVYRPLIWKFSLRLLRQQHLPSPVFPRSFG